MSKPLIPNISAKVVIAIGEDTIIGELSHITCLAGGRRMIYRVIGRYKGWLLRATATELVARGQEDENGEPSHYTAHGDIDVQLIPQAMANAEEREHLQVKEANGPHDDDHL